MSISLVAEQDEDIVRTSGSKYEGIKDSLISEVLPVVDAARAAADGTTAAINLLEPSLRPASLPCYGFEFTQYKAKLSALQASAAATATTSVYTVAAICQAKKNGEEPFLADFKFIKSIVAGTVQASCSATISGKQPIIPANKWVAILAPLLAACLPTASAAYPHFAKSSDAAVLAIYGGLFIVIITLMIGVAAVPFSFRTKSSPETISHHAAFLSFLLLAAIGTGVICTLLSPSGLLALPIAVGSLSAICIVALWFFSGYHYR